MSNIYSTTTLRTIDRKNYYVFGQETYITGIDGSLSMAERRKTTNSVYGRDGGFETYGGYETKTITLDVEIVVDEHEDVYDIIETIHLLLSYQNLEIYVDPPQRYIKVSYKRDSLKEQLGYAGLYIRGTIEFDVIDPFWYNETPKIVTADYYNGYSDGTVNSSNYFYSSGYYYNNNGFEDSDIGNVIYFTDGNNEGYYEIVSVSGGGCSLSSSLTLTPESNVIYQLYNTPSLSKTMIGMINYSGAEETNANILITDTKIKTYYDYLKIQSDFDGTITSDYEKFMFISGLSETCFMYSDYQTIEELVSGVNEYVSSNIRLDYLQGNIFDDTYTRNSWFPSGLYNLSFSSINSGEWKNLMIEDKTMYLSEYNTISDLSTEIETWNTAGDYTYTISGFVSDFIDYDSITLYDGLYKNTAISGSILYAKDYLVYTKSDGNINVGGNYDIYPIIEVINRGSVELDGFDIIRQVSGDYEEARFSYFGTLGENKLLNIDCLNKTVREYDVDLNNKDDYINNVFTNRLNKTTSISDFVYINNDDDIKLIIDTDSLNDINVDILIKFYDRYL